MDVTHFKTTELIQRGGPLAVHGTAIEDADLSSSAPPQWVMLIPAGKFSGRDGRGPFRLADPARVIAATEALGLTAGVPIDYDHATDFAAPEGRPAPAAGWIRELAERAGALWGSVEWTPHGAKAITSREYRYISPVFQYSPDGAVTRLLRAGLTNNPNLYPIEYLYQHVSLSIILTTKTSRKSLTAKGFVRYTQYCSIQIVSLHFIVSRPLNGTPNGTP